MSEATSQVLEPAQYRSYLGRVLNISTEGTMDLTTFIDRGALIATGGFGQVYKGEWKHVSRLYDPQRQKLGLPDVVVKVMYVPTLDDETKKNKRLRDIKREIELWSTLDHENILPLIGMACINGDSNMPAFISPWMKEGSVMDFLKKNPTFSALKFLRDIVRGLHYLHTSRPEIIHGDMKASNVLVNHRGDACLCDFGLSRPAIDNTLWRTTATQASGTLRWMSPELLNGEESMPTRASDIYSYGMTCYEILSMKIPFESVLNDFSLIPKILSGHRPERIDLCRDEIWLLITRCWAQDSHDRPSTAEVLAVIQGLSIVN